jgi:iron-sulfur cluster assembly accessory protein
MTGGNGYVVQEGKANSDGRLATAEPTGSQHMTVSADTSTQQGVVLTDAAAEKAKSLLEQQGEEGLALRVQVQPGGCSGLIYQLYFDDREVDGDLVQDFNGLSVRVDRMSAPYLTGAKIDFVDTIEKQGFTIDNPNASGSCACGDSFH